MELEASNRLEVAVNEKLQGWAIEHAIAAIKCHKKGIVPTLVEYPTGLRKLQFVDGHLTFEVSEKLWEQIKNDGYWLVH